MYPYHIACDTSLRALNKFVVLLETWLQIQWKSRIAKPTQIDGICFTDNDFNE